MPNAARAAPASCVAGGVQIMPTSPPDAVGATPEEIRRVAGALTDDRLAAIAATEASLAEIEVAAAYAKGIGDVPGRDGHALVGRAAAVFDILNADAELLEPER